MCWVSWDRMTAPKAMGGLGLRDIQLFNQALLAKVAWRIITVPDCLLARILKGKYCQRQGFLDTNLPSSCSHGWRSILYGRDLIKDNLGKAIGNGQTTRLWKDGWVSLDANVKPYGPLKEEHMDLMVSDLLTTDLRWNKDRINEIIPELADKILCIQPSRSGAEDRMIWQPQTNGIYTTKSGYFSAAKQSKSHLQVNRAFDNLNWTRDVWRSACSPKLRLFLWSIVNKAIPIGENLQKRGMLSAAKCPRCNEVETDMHIFFTCPFAVEVWKLIPITGTVNIETGRNFIDTLGRFRDTICLPPSGVTGSILPWILWSIWTSRNALIFESRTYKAEETATKGIQLALEWTQAQGKVIKNRVSQGRVTNLNRDNIRIPPPPDRITCKTDAAWNSSHLKAGLAWNFSGPQLPNTITGSIVQEYISSPLIGEALAVLTALGVAKDLGFTNLQVFSDNSTLIGAINGRNQSKELIGIIHDIRSVSSGFSSLSFFHFARSNNSLSDSLAKEALRLSVTSSSVG